MRILIKGQKLDIAAFYAILKDIFEISKGGLNPSQSSNRIWTGTNPFPSHIMEPCHMTETKSALEMANAYLEELRNNPNPMRPIPNPTTVEHTHPSRDESCISMGG